MLLSPTADLQPRGQETHQNRDAGKQHAPSRLSGAPAVCIDGVGLVFGVDIECLIPKDSVGGGEIVRAGRLGDFRTQPASPRPPSRRCTFSFRHVSGGVHRPANPPAVFPDGRWCPPASSVPANSADDSRTSDGDHRSRPAPRRAREFAEKQHILDVLSACGHVRHDKRRTDAPVRSIAEADASDHDSELPADARVLHAEPVAEVPRKEFGVLLILLREPVPKPGVVADDVMIFGLVNSQTNRRVLPARLLSRHPDHASPP